VVTQPLFAYDRKQKEVDNFGPKTIPPIIDYPELNFEQNLLEID